jgi:hypothetical protein
MLFELRQYHIRPGKMAEWLELMEGEIIPFQISKGVVVAGSFVGEDDDSVYIWIRRFENEEHRQQLYEAVYESDHWKEVIGPKVPELMDRSKIQVTRLNPSTTSVIR